MERRIIASSDKEIKQKFKIMKCPFCGNEESKVIDSRETRNGYSIRRRRECLSCKKRFTTHEKVNEIPYMVEKKDRSREPFDSQKLLNGLLKACEKRPIPITTLEEIVEEVESKLQNKNEKELKASDIGRIVMTKLKKLDKVAYVRFASVYREFKDVNEFKKELETLLAEK